MFGSCFRTLAHVAVILVSDFCKAVQIRYCLDKALIKNLNHFCGLDIEHNNPVYSQDTSVYEYICTAIRLSLVEKGAAVQKK